MEYEERLESATRTALASGLQPAVAYRLGLVDLCVIFALDLSCDGAVETEEAWGVDEQRARGAVYYATGRVAVHEAAGYANAQSGCRSYACELRNYTNNAENWPQIGEAIAENLELSGFALSQIAVAEKPQEKEPQQLDRVGEAAAALFWIVASFASLCLVAALLAKLHAWCVGSENVRTMSIAFFALYTWDFFSDMMFVARLADKATAGFEQDRDRSRVLMTALFVTSLLFLIVPYLLNQRTLINAQWRWFTDPVICQKIKDWHLHYGRLLISLSVLCGSSYGVVEVANSNMFGLSFFCMGLSERYLKKYQSTRFWSSFLFENLPQIIVQIIYVLVRRGMSAFDDPIVIWAVTGSALSIAVTLVDVYTAQRLLEAMKHAVAVGGRRNATYFIAVESAEIARRKSLYYTKMNSFKEIVGLVLEKDPRTIEMTTVLHTEFGLKIGFTVFTASRSIDEISNILLAAIQTEVFQNLLRRKWRLINVPDIKDMEIINGYNAQSIFDIEQLINDRNGDKKQSEDSDIEINTESTYESEESSLKIDIEKADKETDPSALLTVRLAKLIMDPTVANPNIEAGHESRSPTTSAYNLPRNASYQSQCY